MKVEETGQTISSKDRRWCNVEDTSSSILVTFQFAYRGDTITLEIAGEGSIILKEYNWSAMAPTLFRVYCGDKNILTAKTGVHLESEGYLGQGVFFGPKITKKGSLQHTVSRLYLLPSEKLGRIPLDGIKVLFICEGKPHLKGADIVEEAMRKILKEMKQVTFIVKTNKPNSLCKLPRTISITDSFTEKKRASLFDSCDILIAPSRGKGYGPDVLKAMMRGVVVIISNRQDVRAYADPYALVIENKTNKNDSDPEHAYRLLYHVILNIESLKKDANRYAQELRGRVQVSYK